MDDNVRLAFEAARDSTKQFLTLATAIIALTITFSKDFTGADAGDRTYALLAWSALLTSVFFGLWTLLALTGTLEPKNNKVSISIRGPNVTIPARKDMLRTNNIGNNVYRTGRPSFINMIVRTNNVMPARIWLVAPNSGQIIMPPLPDEPPAPKASNKQAPTATSVATTPFRSTGISWISAHS